MRRALVFAPLSLLAETGGNGYRLVLPTLDLAARRSWTVVPLVTEEDPSPWKDLLLLPGPRVTPTRLVVPASFLPSPPGAGSGDGNWSLAFPAGEARAEAWARGVGYLAEFSRSAGWTLTVGVGSDPEDLPFLARTDRPFFLSGSASLPEGFRRIHDRGPRGFRMAVEEALADAAS